MTSPMRDDEKLEMVVSPDARARLQIARKDILTALDGLEAKVFKREPLARFLDTNRTFWRLHETFGVIKFIAYLTKIGALDKIELRSEEYGTKTLYARPTASDLEIALAVVPAGYLSHGTAAFLHGLTDQLPTTLYVNREQSPKPPPSAGLTQAAIDRAFRNQPRTSRYIFQFRERRVCIVSGKQTERLEVGTVTGPTGEPLAATKLERTLIDLAVRPQYAGGIPEVLAAYQAAKGRASSTVIIATLKKLDYVYPYHQAIGFYMARAGYPTSALDQLRALGLHHDFYLAAGAKTLDYVAEWRLHIPKGL